MSKRYLLGMLTPSSYTVFEPVTSAMVAAVSNVTAYVSRFRVTEISLADKALGQFKNQPIIEVANLLSEGLMDVITWNGTSSGWLGFDADVELCKKIKEATAVWKSMLISGCGSKACQGLGAALC